MKPFKRLLTTFQELSQNWNLSHFSSVEVSNCSEFEISSSQSQFPSGLVLQNIDKVTITLETPNDNDNDPTDLPIFLEEDSILKEEIDMFRDMEEDQVVVIKDETDLYLYLAIGFGVLSGLLLVIVIILAVMLK